MCANHFVDTNHGAALPLGSLRQGAPPAGYRWGTVMSEPAGRAVYPRSSLWAGTCRVGEGPLFCTAKPDWPGDNALHEAPNDNTFRHSSVGSSR